MSCLLLPPMHQLVVSVTPKMASRAPATPAELTSALASIPNWSSVASYVTLDESRHVLKLASGVTIDKIPTTQDVQSAVRDMWMWMNVDMI